jgi:hypothetical protein
MLKIPLIRSPFFLWSLYKTNSANGFVREVSQKTSNKTIQLCGLTPDQSELRPCRVAHHLLTFSRPFFFSLSPESRFARHRFLHVSSRLGARA